MMKFTNIMAFFVCMLQLGKIYFFLHLNSIYLLANAATTGAQLSNLVATQAFIWVPIGLTLVLLMALCMLGSMDADKNRDTILYAKFISNVKER